MHEIVEVAGAWSVVALFWGVALFILAGLPRAFGRWLSACEVATPWWMTFALLGVAAIAVKMATFHLDWLLAAATAAAPVRLSLTTALQWVFGFAWFGFTGPIEAQAHLQGSLVSGAILLVATVLLYRQRYSIFAMDIVTRRDKEAVPRRVVIMGLSLDPRHETDTAAARQAVESFKAKTSMLDLDAAAGADLGRFPWQQNLRVLRHHLGRELPGPGRLVAAWRWLVRRPAPESCRIVVVLPSPQSAPYAADFAEVAQACAASSGASGVEFGTWERPVDYNDLDALRREILAVVRKVQLDPRIVARLDEISIDTTPGMKLVSIAGAAVTFASPLEFTYVETAPPNSVVAFDVRAAFRIPFER